MDPQPGLGAAISALRKQAGLTQESLASRADLPLDLIAQIEKGLSDPTWGDVRRVAEALDVTLEALSELAEEHEAQQG